MTEGPEPPEERSAFLAAMVTSAGHEVTLWTKERDDDAVKRLLGFAMIFFMPEQGVDEALTSLRDIFEFSYETAHLALPPPVPTRRSIGRIVATSERPDLVIPE